MPRFIYTDHALERMQERGISAAEVEQCVLHPTSTFQPRGKNQYRAEINGRRIKIVVLAKKDTDRLKLIVSAIHEDEEGA
jgi:hypothetical protein